MILVSIGIIMLKQSVNNFYSKLSNTLSYYLFCYYFEVKCQEQLFLICLKHSLVMYFYLLLYVTNNAIYVLLRYYI